MANIVIDIAGTSVSFTLADVDASRILTAYTAMYMHRDIDANGDIVMTPPTVEEVVKQIAQTVVNDLAAYAVRREQDVAAATARESVLPINVTIPL